MAEVIPDSGVKCEGNHVCICNLLVAVCQLTEQRICSGTALAALRCVPAKTEGVGRLAKTWHAVRTARGEVCVAGW